MIKLLLHSWLFSSPLEDGRSRERSACHKIWFLLKKKYRGLKMKYRTLKLLKRRRNARKRIQTTEKGIQALIIILALAVLLLVGCSYKMIPSETKIEYGTTETDSKNDKLQQKQSITQTWKWKQQ